MKRPLYKQLYFLKHTLNCVGFTVGVERFGISFIYEFSPFYSIGRRDRNYHNRYFQIYVWKFHLTLRWNLKQPIDFTYINGNYFQYEIDKVNQTVKLVPAIPGKEVLYYD